MKSLLTSIVLTGALAVSLPVQAGEYKGSHFDHRVDKHEREYRKQKHFDHKYDRKYDGKYDRKHERKYHRDYRNNRHWDNFHNARHGDRVRLDIPVDFRGDGKLALKRLARANYGIDLDDYRLVRVVFDHRGGRKRAAARLFVGQQRSDLVYLQHGRNVVHAPQTRANARGQLVLDNARVSHVRLVLEPRSRFANHNDRYDRDDRRYRSSRYNDYDRRYDWWAYLPFKGEFTWRW